MAIRSPLRSPIRTLIGDGIGGVSTLPSVRTVAWGAKTGSGYGGDSLGYTGQLWLQVYSIDGVVITSNPYGSSAGGLNLPAATTAQPFRVNRENKLVITGDCTTTFTAPPALNASYTVKIREYPSEADAIARTNWTGQEQTATVLCSGNYVLPAVSGYDSQGQTYTLPALTINLANTFCITEWPRCNGTTRIPTTRYPAGYTITNETVAPGQFNQITRTMNSGAPAVGQYMLLRQADYNPPYDDGVHVGTVDLGSTTVGTVPPIATGTISGVVGGTAPEYLDGSFFTVCMEDPVNTTWGRQAWNCSKISFRHAYFKALRPTLNRLTFANALTPSSAAAMGAVELSSVGATYTFVQFRECAFDPQRATAAINANNTLNCIYLIADNPNAELAVVDCYFTGGMSGVVFTSGGVASGWVPKGFNQCVRRNTFQGFFYEDSIKLSSCYQVYIDNNIVFIGPYPSGGHPDCIQLNWNNPTLATTLSLGQITNNIFIALTGYTGSQGIFNSQLGTSTMQNGVIKGNLYIGGWSNAIQMDRMDLATVRNNTLLAGALLESGQSPRVSLTNGTNCTVTGNVQANSNAISAGTGATVTNNLLGITRATGSPNSYAELFAAPPAADGDRAPYQTWVDRYKAKLGGPLDVNSQGWRDPNGNPY